ncbi:hypothetical protein L2K20_01485 [Mycobacterium sp. MBM]|nr:hypothetical protein [Mycobacterium sp. MBM]
MASPTSATTRSIGRPTASATTIASAVAAPVPMSMMPVDANTVPPSRKRT